MLEVVLRLPAEQPLRLVGGIFAHGHARADVEDLVGPRHGGGAQGAFQRAAQIIQGGRVGDDNVVVAVIKGIVWAQAVEDDGQGIDLVLMLKMVTVSSPSCLLRA